jgi:hypothetical protein
MKSPIPPLWKGMIMEQNHLSTIFPTNMGIEWNKAYNGIIFQIKNTA